MSSCRHGWEQEVEYCHHILRDMWDIELEDDHADEPATTEDSGNEYDGDDGEG